MNAETSEDTTKLDDTLPSLADLPKELGVLLASVGVLGLLLPGVAGAPALIAGGVVLWPKTFGKVENWLQNRFPKTHRESMKQVGRFLADLDHRFPIARIEASANAQPIARGDSDARNDRA